jgi:hypothetical protein
MTKKTALMPPLETEEAQQATANILDRRDYLDYRCFMILKEVFPYLKDHFQNMSEEWDDLLDEIDGIIDEREIVNDEFLSIVSGREPRKY